MKKLIRKYYLYVVFSMACFFVGAYLWKIVNTGHQSVSIDASRAPDDPLPNSVIVEVADTKITTEDLDFEYSLHTRGVFASEDLTPIPDLGARYEAELSPLKEGLLSAMIERRLLYQFIKDHTKFSLDDPKRFTNCLEEWQKTISDSESEFSNAGDQERLKQRLCEKDVIEQYLAEVAYPEVEITEDEIREYYEGNKKEFEKPTRVVIRQIVLPDEKAAKKARYGLNRYNFVKRAKELSITPEAKDGGQLGPFAKGEMPRLFDIAFTMRTGDIYGILKSTYGFHLIMLEKKLKAESLSLAEAKPVIKEKLLQQKRERTFQEWIETALDTVQVKSPRPLW